LTFVALLPDFLARGFRFASLPWIGPQLETMLPRFFSEGFGFNFYFGGTSLLIVVGVAMDTVQQVESKLVEHHYTGFLKKSRIRRRRPAPSDRCARSFWGRRAAARGRRRSCWRSAWASRPSPPATCCGRRFASKLR